MRRGESGGSTRVANFGCMKFRWQFMRGRGGVGGRSRAPDDRIPCLCRHDGRVTTASSRTSGRSHRCAVRCSAIDSTRHKVGLMKLVKTRAGRRAKPKKEAASWCYRFADPHGNSTRRLQTGWSETPTPPLPRRLGLRTMSRAGGTIRGLRCAARPCSPCSAPRKLFVVQIAEEKRA